MRFAGYRRRFTLAALGVLVLSPFSAGQGKQGAPPGKAAENAFSKAVNAAIDRGVAYLQKLQGGDGSWPRREMGATPLAALALLESGVSPNHASVAAAAAYVRNHAITETGCYSITTSLLFLDRLGDPQDVPLIEALAVRLLAAQNRLTGGWGYKTPDPGQAEVQQLQALVRNRKNAPLPEGKDAPPRKPRAVKDLPPGVRARIEAIYVGPNFADVQGEDLSNTQFAMLALWVARRHGIPVNRAFALADARLRHTQVKAGAAKGGWSYVVPGTVGAPKWGPALQPTAQMTCAGLMGLMMAHYVLDGPAAAKKRDLAKDTAIRDALNALTPTVGAPTGDWTTAPVLRRRQDRVYYTLWTLERAAVLFGMKTIGKNKNDWYRWGAELILRNQQEDGSWQGEFHEGGCDTCFALLFLKRADLAADLTVRVKRNPATMKLLEGLNVGGDDGKPEQVKPKGGPGGKQSRLAPADTPALRPALARAALPPTPVARAEAPRGIRDRRRIRAAFRWVQWG